MTDPRRALPSVDRLVRDLPSLEQVGPLLAAWLCRTTIDEARARITLGAEGGDVSAIVDAKARALLERRLRPVINATGIPLHTNLGRAPLSDDAVAAVVAATQATTIEFDIKRGRRAERAPVAATLAAALCDAQDALIVNNNAGALLLCLAALARGREVIVSRGELVEIGGGFRLPEIIEAAGVTLREVGTTNKTRASDIERALGPATGMILSVHPSNFSIVGFTEKPTAGEVASIARSAGIPYLFDIGSGLLRPNDTFGDEPDATATLAAGADLICFSGDKLLGGPQAGIIAGRADLLDRIRRHPIARAVRADKLSLAALEATLWARVRGEVLPIDTIVSPDAEQIRVRSAALAARIPGARVTDATTFVGGGAVPGRPLPTIAIVIDADDPSASARRLRAADPPVVARIEGGSLLIDLRAVDPVYDEHIADLLI